MSLNKVIGSNATSIKLNNISRTYELERLLKDPELIAMSMEDYICSVCHPKKQKSKISIWNFLMTFKDTILLIQAIVQFVVFVLICIALYNIYSGIQTVSSLVKSIPSFGTKLLP